MRVPFHTNWVTCGPLTGFLLVALFVASPASVGGVDSRGAMGVLQSRMFVMASKQDAHE